MGKYRKKPVVIEAVQYKGNGNMNGGVPDWIWDAFKARTLRADQGADPLIIHTLEGDMVVSPDDFIIKGIQGELYPCKPDIFEATYELVEDQP